MSDFSTYEAKVIVTMRVSAYDKENAIEVAKKLLLADNTIVSVREVTKLEHSMSDAILKQIKRAAYNDGVVSALSELREVYGAGIEDTDIWAEYMKEGNN